jgi:uncharacterized protein
MKMSRHHVVSAALTAAMLLGGSSPPSRAQDSGRIIEKGPTVSLFAIIYRPGPKWKTGLPMEEQGLRDHFVYMRDLGAREIVAVAGPLGTDGGLFIVRVPDRQAAVQVMEADPAVISGVFTGEVKPFVLTIGGRSPLNVEYPDR